jgi:hypothetical protein
MATPSQTAANQENAKKSTGPKTEEGKERSSWNGVDHGLCGGFVLQPWESRDAFEGLRETLTSEFRPRTFLEMDLVKNMAQHRWLVGRALYYQENAFCEGGASFEKRLALFMRYQSLHERSYYRALHELLNLRETRRKEEIGFASQKAAASAAAEKTELQQARKKHLELTSRVLEMRLARQNPPLQEENRELAAQKAA